MQQLLQQLKARHDAMPKIEGAGYSLRCYRGDLYLLVDTPALSLQPIYTLRAGEVTRIEALNIEISRQQVFQSIRCEDEGQAVQLRFRSAVEAGQAVAHGHRLKRLFQQHRIPPWIRDKIPQVFLDGELVSLLL